MKTLGMFILEREANHECEWLYRKMAQSLPGLTAFNPIFASTPPQLLDLLATNIEQCDLFVIAAEPQQFYSLKKQLLEALELPVRVNEGLALR